MTCRIRMAFLAMLATSHAWAGETGRLFFTPQQRAQLEREYVRKNETDGSTAHFLVLNGIVQHGDGKRTIWINGIAQHSDSLGKQPPDTHSINRPGESRPMQIKVGQHLTMEQPAEP